MNKIQNLKKNNRKKLSKEKTGWMKTFLYIKKRNKILFDGKFKHLTEWVKRWRKKLKWMKTGNKKFQRNEIEKEAD